MPTSIGYPRASFKSAMDLATSADLLGGSASAELCAEKMGNKLGGAFNYIVSAASKFRLIVIKSGQISTSPLFRDIKLAYTDDEKKKLLASSFLSPPVFLGLYERFKGKELPIGVLEKMLIKEYHVDDNSASRIKKYFIEGAKLTGLLNPQNHLISLDIDSANEETSDIEDSSTIQENNENKLDDQITFSLSNQDEFIFHISGPGLNSKIAIRDEEDFIILDAMIKKVKRKFTENN